MTGRRDREVNGEVERGKEGDGKEGKERVGGEGEVGKREVVRG